MNLLNEYTLHDCTLELSNQTPTFLDPLISTVQHQAIQQHSAGYFLSNLSCLAGSGTHIDAPYHFFPNGKTIEQIPQQDLIRPAFIIDVSQKCLQNPDYLLTLQDIQKFEEKFHLEENSFFFFKTGYSQFITHEKQKYKGEDSEGKYHFPGFSLESVQYLHQKNFQAIGIDTLSLDRGISEDFQVHNFWLKQNKFMVENIDLQHIDEGFYQICIITPLKLVGAGESPCKVLLFKNKKF